MLNLMLERKKKKMTQSDLAKEIGVSRVSVARWETGESYPSISILLQLSEFFEVSVDYLLGKE